MYLLIYLFIYFVGRSLLCDVFDQLSRFILPLRLITEPVRKMNSFSIVRLDEYDYTAR
jgi:hypothetical protein